MTRDAIISHLETVCEGVGLHKASAFRDTRASNQDTFDLLWGNAESEQHDHQRALVLQPVIVRVRSVAGGDADKARRQIDAHEVAIMTALWGGAMPTGVWIEGIDTAKEQGDGHWECNLTVETKYLLG